jgi:conjugal transfer ATP-binding protein TraC
VLDPLSATVFSSDPDTYAAIHRHVATGMPLERAVALVAGMEGGA